MMMMITTRVHIKTSPKTPHFRGRSHYYDDDDEEEDDDDYIREKDDVRACTY